jgi:hypothetical protein
MSIPHTLSMLYNTSMRRHLGAPSNNHVNNNGLQTVVAGGKSGGGEILYGGQRFFGTPMRFQLDEEWRRLQPRVMLTRLGVKPERSPGIDPIQQLVLLINKRADELPLPDGCLAITSQQYHPIFWSDPLTALAILSKSSDTLWLRSKSPSLLAAAYYLSRTLIVPPNFCSYPSKAKK